MEHKKTKTGFPTHQEVYGMSYEEHGKQFTNNLKKYFAMNLGEEKIETKTEGNTTYKFSFDYELLHTIIQKEGFYLTYKDDLEYYQTNEYGVKYFLQLIREYWINYNDVPSFSELFMSLKKENTRYDENGKEYMYHLFNQHNDTLEYIKNNKPKDYKFIEDVFKEKLIEGIENSIENKNYDKVLRSKLLKRLAYYETNNVGIPEFDIRKPSDYDENENREIIPTGIELIDENGGIARGEIGMFIAPTGVGKSTLLTYVASNFAKQKLKVIHIVFEGKLNHYLKIHNKLITKDLTYINDYIDIIKMEDGTTTINDVMSTIKIANKQKLVDVIVIDYIDCIRPNQKQKEFWMGESEVVNELEKYAVKNNLVIWTAVQTNRSGLNGEEGEMAQIAGSKKKLDKCSMAVFLSRGALQIDARVATMKIDKNRNGAKAKSVNFEYDPERMIIDTTNILTL